MILAPLALKSLNADDLVEYVLENRVDLVVRVNLSELKYKENLKRLQFTAYKETSLSERVFTPNGPQLQRHKIDFSLNEKLADNITVRPIDYVFTSVNVDNLDVKSKVASVGEEVAKYTKEEAEKLASVLLSILNSHDAYHERIVFICRFDL